MQASPDEGLGVSAVLLSEHQVSDTDGGIQAEV